MPIRISKKRKDSYVQDIARGKQRMVARTCLEKKTAWFGIVCVLLELAATHAFHKFDSEEKLAFMSLTCNTPKQPDHLDQMTRNFFISD